MFLVGADQYLESSGTVRPPVYTNPYAFLMTPHPHSHAGTGSVIVPSAPSSDATHLALGSPNSTIVQFQALQPQLDMYGYSPQGQPVQNNTQMSMTLPSIGCNGTTATTLMACKDEALSVSARIHDLQCKLIIIHTGQWSLMLFCYLHVHVHVIRCKCKHYALVNTD